MLLLARYARYAAITKTRQVLDHKDKVHNCNISPARLPHAFGCTIIAPTG